MTEPKSILDRWAADEASLDAEDAKLREKLAAKAKGLIPGAADFEQPEELRRPMPRDNEEGDDQ